MEHTGQQFNEIASLICRKSSDILVEFSQWLID